MRWLALLAASCAAWGAAAPQREGGACRPAPSVRGSVYPGSSIAHRPSATYAACAAWCCATRGCVGVALLLPSCGGSGRCCWLKSGKNQSLQRWADPKAQAEGGAVAGAPPGPPRPNPAPPPPFPPLPPAPPPAPPLLAPSARDPDWRAAYRRAELLYDEGPRPDFSAPAMWAERCTQIWPNRSSVCPALWARPGLGNGFLGTIAQSPTIRIAGFYSGDSVDNPRYSCTASLPPQPSGGYSNRLLSFRARIPAFASSLALSGPIKRNSSRFALDLTRAVFIERHELDDGAKLELRQYAHHVRRNLLVVEVDLDCSRCSSTASVQLASLTGEAPLDITLHRRGASPPRLLGVLNNPETNIPPFPEQFDTNYSKTAVSSSRSSFGLPLTEAAAQRLACRMTKRRRASARQLAWRGTCSC